MTNHMDLVSNRRPNNYTSSNITIPEKIVREFRIADRGIRIESVKQPISKIERAIRIFLLITLGWVIGYLHHFLTNY